MKNAVPTPSTNAITEISQKRIRLQRDDDNEDAHGDARARHPRRSSATSGPSGRPRPLPGSAKSACGIVRAKRTKPALAARARQREHEQRIGDRRQPRPDVGEQLPGLEQHEVAVTAQGNRVHGMTLSVRTPKVPCSAVDASVAAADRPHDRVRQRARPPPRRGRRRPPPPHLDGDVVELPALRRRRHHGRRAARGVGDPEVTNALHAGRHGAVALRVRQRQADRCCSEVEARRLGQRSSASSPTGSSAPRPSARRRRRSRRRCSARSRSGGNSGSERRRSTSSVGRWTP